MAAVILCTGLAACQSPKATPTPEARWNPALVVLPGAIDVKALDPSGESVVYRIEARFPASQVLAGLSAALTRDGWYPLANDLLNPSMPASHSTGWQRFIDGTATPAVRVHQWKGDWANDHGDAVTYFLKYRSQAIDSEVPEDDRLVVTAAYLSAERLGAEGTVVPKRP